MEFTVLPIHAYESQIVEAVRQNTVVVLIGETGSGKTTQLSQMLHKAGHTKTGRIGVTQPRRVAAVSVARRVAFEMGVTLGEEVGYAIRFEDRTSSKTCIKYLTDGCLLRECLFDPELQQYSVIILDEAHERSLNTDILLGLMRRLVGKRKLELKVVITSATLDGEKMSDFFFSCPIVRVPGKLYPVQIFYSKERPVSYLEASIQTALDIHVRESSGDILLFMTGQEEIEKVLVKLEDGIKTLEEGSCMDAIILPLYGSLPPEMQARVFAQPPENCRRIIVATNIAETSLTVDGVVYVIDPGMVKQRQYNPSTGMDSLAVVPISRVQAIQRAGRAGRTRPGQCYRLYPESAYQHELLMATVPEIQRSSLTGTVLHLKSLELADIDVLRFDFLDPPSTDALKDALRQLFMVDAIDEEGSITALGKRMAVLPLEPSLARALIAAEDLDCLDQALTVAAMLSCESIFSHSPGQGKDKKRVRDESNLPDGGGLGDHIQFLQIYEAWRQHDYDFDWCKQNRLQSETGRNHIQWGRRQVEMGKLSYRDEAQGKGHVEKKKREAPLHDPLNLSSTIRAMKFAKDVRRQLGQIMQRKRSYLEEEKHTSRTRKKVGSARSLRKALCIGFANHLAHRLPRHNGYRTIGHRSQLVQVHPLSCPLEVDRDGLTPEWVLYHELISTTHPFIRQICAVEGTWVEPYLVKLEKIDLARLSGRTSQSHASQLLDVNNSDVGAVQSDIDKNKPNPTRDSAAIMAARERFLARKQSKTMK